MEEYFLTEKTGIIERYDPKSITLLMMSKRWHKKTAVFLKDTADGGLFHDDKR